MPIKEKEKEGERHKEIDRCGARVDTIKRKEREAKKEKESKRAKERAREKTDYATNVGKRVTSQYIPHNGDS